jgi:hypothetical protein
VKLYAIGLCALYLLTKLLVRPWVFRPVSQRPVGLRHQETLQVLDLFAALALLGAVFMFINAGLIAAGIAAGLSLAGFDLVLRSVFLRAEIRRLQKKSTSRSYRSVRKQVLRRTLSDTTY